MAKRHTVSARFLLLLFSTDGWLVSGALTKSSSVQPPTTTTTTTENCSLRQDRDAADDRRRRQDGKRWASERETGKQERLSLNFTYSSFTVILQLCWPRVGYLAAEFLSHHHYITIIFYFIFYRVFYLRSLWSMCPPTSCSCLASSYPTFS